MQGKGTDPERIMAQDEAFSDGATAPVGEDLTAAIAAEAADAAAQEGAGAEATTAGGDDMLDVVRQMIAEAEALPAPPPAPVPVRTVAVPVAAPVAPAYPDFSDFNETAPDDGWDEDWNDHAAATEEAQGADWDGAAAPAPVRRSLTGRALKALGRLLWRLMRVLGRQGRIFLAWAWRHVWAFLKQPDAPRRLSVVVIVAAVLTWPWFVLKIAFLFPLGIVALWAATGNNGFAELVTEWHAGLKQRDPVKAERIRKAAAWGSRTIMRGVDRLPSHWTTGFSLPDFEGSYAVPEKMKVDAFEDFAEKVRRSKKVED
ncbi:MAG: hypothetical protein KDK10_00685 [Maritimibacter sp.]|nr:hypothetical protein [Maritimibacter sp.]